MPNRGVFLTNELDLISLHSHWEHSLLGDTERKGVEAGNSLLQQPHITRPFSAEIFLTVAEKASVTNIINDSSVLYTVFSSNLYQ